MKKSKTPSFVLTLPLCCEKWQKDRLDKLFRVCCNIYNNLTADRLGALKSMERTKRWKVVQKPLSELYAKRDAKTITEEDFKKLAAPLYKKRDEILKDWGFYEYGFHKQINKWRNHHKKLVNIAVAQKIASAVWSKYRAYFFSRGKSIQFVSLDNYLSIEGKNNMNGIIYRDGTIKIGKMAIPVAMPNLERNHSSDVYEAEALSHRVKYCHIKRQWCNGWRYFVQLILEGEPPVKVKPSTGEVLHPMGNGRVGHDIGTQTLAYCSDSAVGLVELAPAVKNIDKELRRINRAMDRSRRATNPKMFKPNGTVVDKDKLPPECLTRRGKRKWVKSKRYKELASKRRTLYQKQAALRVQLHHELANQLLTLGDEHYIEQMRFRGLAKKAKEAKKSKTGKNLSRKRFGKSIANKAPATFVNILEDKVVRAGGTFQKIKTWEAKASQYNHLDHSYNKKKLSQRWNNMPDGRRIQRDLYSAFLIQNTNPSLDGFDTALCDARYPQFCILHDEEIHRLQGIKLPSSAGL